MRTLNADVNGETFESSHIDTNLAEQTVILRGKLIAPKTRAIIGFATSEEGVKTTPAVCRQRARLTSST